MQREKRFRCRQAKVVAVFFYGGVSSNSAYIRRRFFRLRFPNVVLRVLHAMLPPPYTAS